MSAVGIRFELILKARGAGRPKIDPNGVVGPGDAAVDIAAAGDGVVAVLGGHYRLVLLRVEPHVEKLAVGGDVHGRRVLRGARVPDVPS